MCVCVYVCVCVCVCARALARVCACVRANAASAYNGFILTVHIFSITMCLSVCSDIRPRLRSSPYTVVRLERLTFRC